jgi:Holliday junction resolvase-like predicted endonuclease
MEPTRPAAANQVHASIEELAGRLISRPLGVAGHSKRESAEWARLSGSGKVNIVAAVAKHLARAGWTIEHTADTASSQAGIDILARKAGEVLAVEVKGYPSKYYERGPNKGEPKRANLGAQARHWYAEALFSAVLRKCDNPTYQVAIAFPEFPIYTSLAHRTRDALRRLDLITFFVKQSGEVVHHLPSGAA